MALNIGGTMSASPIALGCMRLASLSVPQAETLVMQALQEGVNFFDHADIYAGGESEKIFGEILRRQPALRGKIFIQDKCGICDGYYDASKEHIIQAAEGSLARLGIEQLDVLLLHRPDTLMEPDEVAEAFTRLKRDGKVRRFGVSNMNVQQLQLLARYIPDGIAINQMQIGLAHTTLIDEGLSANTDASQAIVRTGGVLEYCRGNGITLQAWSPLQYGMFEGPFLTNEHFAPLNKEIRMLAQKYAVTDTAIAVAWLLRHPAGIQVITGTTNKDRLTGLCAAARVRLTRPEWYRLYRLAGNPLP